MSQANVPEFACPVCCRVVSVRTSESKRGKVALVLVCPTDGRHFRAFINDKQFVDGIVERATQKD